MLGTTDAQGPLQCKYVVKLKEQGGQYERADDWNSKVSVAGQLITGQNPQSSLDTAKALVEKLS